MREHGGNLDVAQRRFGGPVEDWIDLSTGINRVPYPDVGVEPRQWNALPSRSDIESLHHAARQAYGTGAPIVAIGGAQAAIQLLPNLVSRGRARTEWRPSQQKPSAPSWVPARRGRMDYLTTFTGKSGRLLRGTANRLWGFGGGGEARQILAKRRP